MNRDHALARLCDRFGDAFTSSLELEPGDRYIAVEDAGHFFASIGEPTREAILHAMTIAANNEQPSNFVGYIDLDEPTDIILVAPEVRMRSLSYSASISAHDDDIRYEIERSR